MSKVSKQSNIEECMTIRIGFKVVRYEVLCTLILNLFDAVIDNLLRVVIEEGFDY